MASDEEIARQVSRLEERRNQPSGSTRAELDEYRQAAGEIHDELAARIERVDDRTPDEDQLEAVIGRLEALETRLDSLEARLQD